MGYKTKVDWCDSSWNPVTGCIHDCPYCYASGIAKRFGAHFTFFPRRIHVRETPMKLNDRVQPYPYDFEPTLHKYKLDEPQLWKKPRTIFVCSMADLFGEWVPDEWIKDVFEACGVASRHRYLFLTKNPERYIDLVRKRIMPAWDNMWYGYSATREDQLWKFTHADECPCMHLFVSIEPMLEPMNPGFCSHVPADWVIIGAETGNRKGKVVPEKGWVMEIAEECELSGIPVFMKESLRGIMGEDFRQEFPW